MNRQKSGFTAEWPRGNRVEEQNQRAQPGLSRPPWPAATQRCQTKPVQRSCTPTKEDGQGWLGGRGGGHRGYAARDPAVKQYVDIGLGQKFEWTDLQIGKCATDIEVWFDEGRVRPGTDVMGMFDESCSCATCSMRLRVFEADKKRHERNVFLLRQAACAQKTPVLERVAGQDHYWHGPADGPQLSDAQVQTVQLVQSSDAATEVGSDFDCEDKGMPKLTTAAKRRLRMKRVQERWKKLKCENDSALDAGPGLP
jgi:hypothetical protein